MTISYTKESGQGNIFTSRENDIKRYLKENNIDNFIWCRNVNEGISATGIKDEIIKILNK